MSSEFSLDYHIPAFPHFSSIVIFISIEREEREGSSGEREREFRILWIKEHWSLFDLVGIWAGRGLLRFQTYWVQFWPWSPIMVKMPRTLWLPFAYQPLSCCCFLYVGKAGQIDSWNWDSQFSPLASHPVKGWLFSSYPQGLPISGSSPEPWIEVWKLLPFSAHLSWAHFFLECSLSRLLCCHCSLLASWKSMVFILSGSFLVVTLRAKVYFIFLHPNWKGRSLACFFNSTFLWPGKGHGTLRNIHKVPREFLWHQWLLVQSRKKGWIMKFPDKI